MKETGHHGDYHSLLNLHHSILLRRNLRGDLQTTTDQGEDAAAAFAAWPQRMADLRLMRESLVTVEPLADTLAHLYNALFRERPCLRAMFPESLVAQRNRLASSVRQLVDGLDKPEVIVPLFEELGRTHRKLGVNAAHFQTFGMAFIEALHTRAGIAWRPEYTEAWSRAYQFMAEIMSKAAERALTAPPYVLATVIHHEQRGANLAILRVHTVQPYPYLAGQYATVESQHLPHTWRDYSIAGSPGDGLLEFHVRATGAGQLSDVLVNKTAVGDVLRLGPAKGTMTLAPASGRSVLLVAGGTGLAPIRALLGDLVRQANPPVTWLFFGARTKNELYDLELLDAYADRYPWLRLVLTVSDGDAYPYEYGTLVDAVTRRGGWAGHDAYLSGPAQMVAAVERRLVELGTEPGHIRYDPQ